MLSITRQLVACRQDGCMFGFRVDGLRHTRRARPVRSPLGTNDHARRSSKNIVSFKRVLRAVGSSDPQTYKGEYGTWSVDQEDILEVYSYRVSLSITAIAMLTCTATALLPADSAAHAALLQFLDPAIVVGGASFGAALFLIHIYVDPIKRTLQALWAAGFAGAMWLMATQADPLPVYVMEHREAVWFVGPFFAALTGLSFKEGLCYGKPEAALLALLLPPLLLAHLSGLLAPGPAEQLLLAAATLCFCVLAGRKYTQAVKDDIGDKSVFTFRKLPAEQQAAVLARMELEGRAAD